jgi:hypothetical protein
MPVEQISYNGPDGATLGASSTETISFYGAAVRTRYVGVGAASTYVLLGQTTDAMSTYFLNSAAAVTSLVGQVSSLTVAMRNIGLID